MRSSYSASSANISSSSGTSLARASLMIGGQGDRRVDDAERPRGPTEGLGVGRRGHRGAGGRRRPSPVGPLGIDVVDRGERHVLGACPSPSAAWIACAPPARRSSTLTTPATVRPSLRTRSSASIVEPPVVTTSSTITQRSPGAQLGALDPALQAVLLALFAHDERLRDARRERRARHRDRAHGNAADRARPPRAGPIGDQRADRGERLGQQDRALGIDVVLRLCVRW